MNAVAAHAPAAHPAAAQTGRSLGEYLKLIKRRWIYVATILPGCLLIAVILAFALPPSYRATALVMQQGSLIPKDFVSTTVKDQDDNVSAQQALELVRRRVMDPDQLMPLLKKLDPYPNRKDLTPELKAGLIQQNTSLERVDPITNKPSDTSPAFTINYDNPDPELAKKMGREITDLFVTYNRRNRIEQATAAYQFLQSQAKALEDEMVGMERKLAAFRAKYSGALPEMQARNLTRIDAVQKDLETSQQQLLVAQQKEAQLQLQLNTIAPSMSGAVSDWKTQLGKAQADLIEAQQKYTPEHPEVKRLKREIADLQAQGRSGLARGGATPDNPDYLAVKSQLDSATREVAALTAIESRARAEIAEYEKYMTTAPNVQREYTQLQRDYENARQRYDDLQAKMKNAALAQTMETENKGERFTLLHNARVPETPYFPNRMGIILLGFVLGCAFAFGTAAMVDASDPTVRGSGDLQALLSTEPLGAIPHMLNPADRRKRRLAWAGASVAYAAGIAVAVFVVLIAK